jgi:hypothetical protein
MLPPLGSGHHHVYVAAAAVRAHQPIGPIENGDLGAVPLGDFRGIGLGSVTARPAPDDKSDTGRSRVAQRHGRPWRDFFRRSRLGASSLFGGRLRWFILSRWRGSPHFTQVPSPAPHSRPPRATRREQFCGSIRRAGGGAGSWSVPWHRSRVSLGGPDTARPLGADKTLQSKHFRSKLAAL